MASLTDGPDFTLESQGTANITQDVDMHDNRSETSSAREGHEPKVEDEDMDEDILQSESRMIHVDMSNEGTQ